MTLARAARSRWAAIALGAGALAASQATLGAVRARHVPSMAADAPGMPLGLAGIDLVLPARLMNATSQREKGPPAGVCEYPGPYAPCWCAHLWGLGSCDSPEDYLEDVQRFGPPRAFVPVSREHGAQLTVEVDGE